MHLSADEDLDYFQFLVVMIRAAMNMDEHLSSPVVKRRLWVTAQEWYMSQEWYI